MFLLPIVARYLRDNRCVYMAHVCFYVCCSDCVGLCRTGCCVEGVVEDIVLALE